jgi:phosphoribosyl-ATP pyrophosphohydrolase/phosphoribosyl-AMP cyclohydrolase
MDDISSLQFSPENELLPVVVQNYKTGKILMVAFANKEAVEKTIQTGFAHFWSRSRKKLWKKGEESGNTLKIIGIQTDCDKDALLYFVDPKGNTCHTGVESCFFRGSSFQTDAEFLGELENIIFCRQKEKSKNSYVASLFEKGLDRIAQKVGEEGIEVVIAAKNSDVDELLDESADLIFHLLVLLRKRQKSLHDVINVLKKRHKKED